MATAHITPDHDAVVTEVFVAAPPERVFQTIVDRAQALQWGSNPRFQVIEWELDPRLGGKWTSVSVEQGSSRKYEHHGEVLEIAPPRLLVYTWFANWHQLPSHQTIVRWDLSPASGGPGLRLHTAVWPSCSTHAKRTARAGLVWSRASKHLLRSKCFAKEKFTFLRRRLCQTLSVI
jgi:uncharacterized protein YndB with AHSA1/START domain